MVERRVDGWEESWDDVIGALRVVMPVVTGQRVTRGARIAQMLVQR